MTRAALFVLAGGIVFAVIVPKKYVVTTRIELLQPTVHVGDAEESATLREVENIHYHLKNRDRIEETIASGNWAEYAVLDEDERNDFVDSVTDDVRVNVLTKPDKNSPDSSVFVDITYKDVDGTRAVRFLNALTDSWIKDVVERDYNQLVAERDEVVAARPSASFIPFNVAGLQCALAEACLFGWHLWGAEAAASAALGDATARALMIPPERSGGPSPLGDVV